MMNEMILKVGLTWAPMRPKFFVFILSLGLAGFPLSLPAESVTLFWNPNQGNNVAGYMLYYGTDGVVFNSQANPGTNVFCTVTGLQPGTTNYFEVVAYNANNEQSAPSSLVKYSVPDAAKTAIIQANANINFNLIISGNGTLAPDLNGETLQGGRKYTLTATAGKDSVFAGWVSNGVVVAASKKYTFSVEPNLVLRANFMPNPFLPVAGTYHGLFYATNGVADESFGSFVVTVTSSGAFSAKLCLGAQSYSYSGEFSLAGLAVKSIRRPALSPITVQFQLASSNGPMTGTISGSTWATDIVADPAVYSRTNSAPQAGKYTLLFPGSVDSSDQPAGNGFGAVTVNPSGHVTFSGMLGDGTPVSSTSIVSSQGQWPLYVSLYGGKGSLLGWLSFTNNGDIMGRTGWFKPPEPTAKLYPAGFTNSNEVIGSVYHYTNDFPILNFIDGFLSLADGDLQQNITNEIVLNPTFQANGPSVNNQNTGGLTFQTSSGLFKGSVMNMETGKLIAINGVVLQEQNFGAGFFLGTNESGSVVLSPAR